MGNRMNFERGKDPKTALGIGWEKVLEKMGGLVFYETDLYQNINHQYYDIKSISIHNIRKGKKWLYEAYIIIVIVGNQFRIMKNRIGNDDQIYPLTELPSTVLKLKEKYDVWKDSR